MLSKSFFMSKKVMVTGHTGFKGTWLCRLLLYLGANVTGYALEAEEPSLFSLTNTGIDINSIIADIRDFDSLFEAIQISKPEVVLHLAAQPIVLEGYQRPRYTYETNVMGTVNILEAIRQTDSVRSFVNVTTDKVYLNHEWEWGYRENDELNGFDPYSNSKTCSELVTGCYRNSFFSDKSRQASVAISTARAGNVIGGGDFARNRIIPDCVRAAVSGKDIIVRNPYSIRPYQHVLDPVYCYLMIAEKQYDRTYADSYNIGPDDEGCIQTGELVELFTHKWGNNIKWVNNTETNAPHEANFLKLDCAKLKNKLLWKPRWGIEEAVERTVEWHKCLELNEDINNCMDKQIEDFLN